MQDDSPAGQFWWLAGLNGRVGYVPASYLEADRYDAAEPLVYLSEDFHAATLLASLAAVAEGTAPEDGWVEGGDQGYGQVEGEDQGYGQVEGPYEEEAQPVYQDPEPGACSILARPPLLACGWNVDVGSMRL